MKTGSHLRSVAEGALFQAAFTAVAIGALEGWARICEARRHRAGHH